MPEDNPLNDAMPVVLVKVVELLYWSYNVNEYVVNPPETLAVIMPFCKLHVDELTTTESTINELTVAKPTVVVAVQSPPS